MQRRTVPRMVFISSLIGFFGFFLQMYFTMTYKMNEGHSFLYSLNYFLSFFTIITNLMLAIFLFTVSVWPDSKPSVWFKNPVVNGGMCLYILIVGIIFYALLFKDVHNSGPEAIATHILHAFMPLTYLYCWYFYFRRSALNYKDSFKWLSVPAVYFIYLMIRGQIIGKYPYFFVDVGRFGILKVALFAVAILSFFYLLGSLLIFIDRRNSVQSK